MRTIIIIVLAVLCGAALTGCGKPYEDARAFVAAINAEGAGQFLGSYQRRNPPRYGR